MNDNPILLHVRRAREEAEQRRIVERALAEATPTEKITQRPATTSGDRLRLRGTPIKTNGVGRTARASIGKATGSQSVSQSDTDSGGLEWIAEQNARRLRSA